MRIQLRMWTAVMVTVALVGLVAVPAALADAPETLAKAQAAYKKASLG